MISKFILKRAAIFTLFFFVGLCLSSSLTVANENTPAPANEKSQSESTGIEKTETGPEVTEVESPDSAETVLKAKKKFPWLLVGAGVVVVGVLAYFLLIKKKEQTLTINLGVGTTGTPAVTAKYKKGTAVSYNYTPQAGYGSLLVKLDGVAVAASGTVNMDKDHSLDVSATQQFTLTVNLGTGTTGTPAATTSYNKDQVVNYSYSALTGYSSLQVKLDGVAVASSGTVTMNINHILDVSATQQFTLTVNLGTGTTGTPAVTANYDKGKVVNYSYSALTGYTSLQVKLDGVVVPASGSVTMNTNHTLDVSSTQQFTLTVHLGTGTTGLPAVTAKYNKGQVVNFSYTTLTGYSTLQVKLDGAGVLSSGKVTMNGNHTLDVSASPSRQYTLTVSLGAGTTGTPAATAKYYANQGVNYNYKALPGYTNLQVIIDSYLIVPPSGTIYIDNDRKITITATVIPLYDIRGTWHFHVTGLTANSVNILFSGTASTGTLKLIGYTNTGTYVVSGTDVSFGIGNGIYFKGSFANSDEMSGTHTYGRWSATRGTSATETPPAVPQTIVPLKTK